MTHPLAKTWMFRFLSIIQWNLVLCLTKFVDTLAATTDIKITEIIPFTEKTKVKNWTFLVSMDVMSLDTNIQKTGVYRNCLSQSKWKFLEGQPIPTHYLPEMFRLILKENVFHFNGKHYLQNYGTAMGTKTSVLIPLPIFSWHILKQQL